MTASMSIEPKSCKKKKILHKATFTTYRQIRANWHWRVGPYKCHKFFHYVTLRKEGRDSSVSKATRYGLDGLEIESRWGRDFPHPSRPALGSPNLLHNGYWVFPGGKAAGAWRWPPSPSIAEVTERVELYNYSTSGPSLLFKGELYLLTLYFVRTRWLQIGRSLIRFQLVSLELFIDIKSFWSHYDPRVDSASNRNEYQDHFLG